tara:strand:+ start:344 stop:568 length:225 start_codon:yes stop_codon:yes gene_type:complete
MAEKKAKKEVKTTSKTDSRLKAIEDRLTALESLSEKVLSTEKDLEYAGDSYDELNSWVDDLDKIVKRIRTRMGI